MPVDESAGIVCCKIGTKEPSDVIKHLSASGIEATTSPGFVRFSPSVLNHRRDIEKTLEVLDALIKTA